jgi:mannose-1-phosphate guanylyltransferase/mannose-6-phosphate isomerase
VAASEDYLVTFGILPTHAETGFGYIKAASGNVSHLPENACAVECFTEKPDLNTAQNYIEQGDYYWNSGMFVWKVSAILEAFKKYLPEVNQVLDDIDLEVKNGGTFQTAVNQYFADMPNISIDYGVLEKIVAEQNKLLVIPCDVKWNDVGSWDAVHQISAKDSVGNVIQGNVLALDCKNTLIKSHGRLIAAVGIEDICVIETQDAILLTKRGDTQRVKEVVDELHKRNIQEGQIHLTVSRPWGKYTVLENQEGFKIKRIVVNPGASLSLQSHQHRSEHWVVVSGTATVTCDDKTIIVTKNQSTYIPVGERHRLENRGKIEVHLIEVQVGEYVGEDDIERFDDMYHRLESVN